MLVYQRVCGFPLGKICQCPPNHLQPHIKSLAFETTPTLRNDSISICSFAVGEGTGKSQDFFWIQLLKELYLRLWI
jgi:hypothetical protein